MAIQRRISRMPPDEKVCIEVEQHEPVFLTEENATPVVVRTASDEIERMTLAEIVEIAAAERAEVEYLYENDPVRQAHIAETEGQIAEVMDQIQTLAQRRYALDKQINRLSIKLNHLRKVRVNLTLPFYEHK
jgi:septal ring factor EnvC (AmiA/AmiB activator)